MSKTGKPEIMTNLTNVQKRNFEKSTCSVAFPCFRCISLLPLHSPASGAGSDRGPHLVAHDWSVEQEFLEFLLLVWGAKGKRAEEGARSCKILAGPERKIPSANDFDSLVK